MYSLLTCRGDRRLRNKCTPSGVPTHDVLLVPNCAKVGSIPSPISKAWEERSTVQLIPIESHGVIHNVWVILFTLRREHRRQWPLLSSSETPHTWPICLCKAPIFTCHKTVLHLVWGEVLGTMGLILASCTSYEGWKPLSMGPAQYTQEAWVNILCPYCPQTGHVPLFFIKKGALWKHTKFFCFTEVIHLKHMCFSCFTPHGMCLVTCEKKRKYPRVFCLISHMTQNGSSPEISVYKSRFRSCPSSDERHLYPGTRYL